MAQADDEIGLTGIYGFGKPLIEGDQGGLNAQFVINQEEQQAAFLFGKAIGGFGLTRREAHDMASRIRNRITEVFGEIECPTDLEDYPIVYDHIETEAGPRVMLWMPKMTSIIVGSPVFWLIFCARLDAKASQILEN